jgi:hypothetical protein
VKNYCEVLSTTAAPKFQHSAPRTLQEAMSRLDASQWREAWHAEMGALAAREVMTLMMLPNNKRAISLRWVFTYKLRPDGSIERNKTVWLLKVLRNKRALIFMRFGSPQCS